MRRIRPGWLAVLGIVAASLAACGGGGAPTSGGAAASGGATAGSGGDYGGYGRQPATPSTSAGAAGTAGTIGTASTSLGTVLVSDGRTVYLFEKDTAGTAGSPATSACSGACATAWPPVTVTGSPAAGPGVQADLLGTTKRPDGSTEVTYAGHPLYWFSGDSAPGDVNGEGSTAFGAGWYVVSPNGQKVDSD
jgi:predicted lipoprotein with Yx(FWY)xxD motif